MVTWIVFGALTALLLAATFIEGRGKWAWAWARLAAFELNLILIFLGLAGWFRAPWSPAQIASWLLLAASVAVLSAGVALLVARGKPEGTIQHTTRLVDSGIFKYLRHPMYASLAYLAWGLFFKAPGWLGALLATAACLAAWLTARIEEKEALVKFGEDYAAYMKRTRMLAPFIF